MKRARLITPQGESIPVHTTTEHPDSHYGKAVWVDDEGTAYLQEGMERMNPFYRLADITED